jgi:hypothetical protein
MAGPFAGQVSAEGSRGRLVQREEARPTALAHDLDDLKRRIDVVSGEVGNLGEACARRRKEPDDGLVPPAAKLVP